MTGTLWTFGETMAVARTEQPLRLGGPMHLSIAGSESNVAIGMARLGHRSHWISRIGNDELGALILRTMRAEGVHPVAGIDSSRPTGLMLTDHAPTGQVRVHYYRAGSAIANVETDPPQGVAMQEGDLLHVTGITAALGAAPAAAVTNLVQQARLAGTVVSFDVNFRSRLWSRQQAGTPLTKIARWAGIVIASEDELGLVATGHDERERVQDLRDNGVDQVVVKRGASGATAYSTEGRFDQPALVVNVKNTTGAGDAFVAGYLSAVLDGESTKERLHRAVTVGACAVTSTGDWEGLPSREDLTLLTVGPEETLR